MDNIKEEMEKQGVTLIIEKDLKLTGPFLMVEADLDIVLPLEWINNCILKKITKRNTEFYCAFKQLEDKLTLKFFTKCPPETNKVLNLENVPVYFTTFVDMCWLYSEGTTNQTAEEVATRLRGEDGNENIPADLTWILPSKFIDDLIEMVHTINPEFMSGLMQDSVIYGPYIVDSYKV